MILVTDLSLTETTTHRRLGVLVGLLEVRLVTLTAALGPRRVGERERER